MADVVVINKVDTADLVATERRFGITWAQRTPMRARWRPLRLMADGAERITGRRVLVVEDGPALTHSEMRFGAGTVLARNLGPQR